MIFDIMYDQVTYHYDHHGCECMCLNIARHPGTPYLTNEGASRT